MSPQKRSLGFKRLQSPFPLRQWTSLQPISTVVVGPPFNGAFGSDPPFPVPGGIWGKMSKFLGWAGFLVKKCQPITVPSLTCSMY